MTSANAAVAEAWRLQYLIRRVPPGWTTPVTVQDWPPNTPGYSWAVAGRVDHCGLSINTVLHNVGLVVGRDFGNQAWTPSGFSWFRGQGRAVSLSRVRAGDVVYFSNTGNINAITHVELAVEDARSDGGVPCLGWNTDTTGQGVYRVRYGPYMVAAGRPAYATVQPEGKPEPAPEPKPEPKPTITRRRLITQEDDMTSLIQVHTDGNPDAHEEFWVIACGVPARVDTDGVAGPVDRKFSRTEWDAWLQAWTTANNLARDVAWTGPAQKRPVFRQAPAK